jgi:signal transduction histidine kinase
LRTPLAVIGAQAHVLSHERSPDKQAQALATLQAGVQRAGDVLSNVLMLSRMDAANANTLATEAIDLPEFLRDRVAEHVPRSMVLNHNLGLLNEPAETMPMFQGNRAMLTSALDNLIDNALRYTPPGSQVDVAWAIFEGREVWITVEDNGPGIEKPDQARVFQRFERGPLAHLAPGSGLGLSIAKGVAAIHGGTLILEPRPSCCGCRFVMRLPLHR